MATATSSVGIAGKTEADALQMFEGHPNIVQLIDYSLKGETLYIILEFCEGGSVRDLLIKQGGKLEEEFGLKVLLDIANGLSAMHAKSCIHRDLKPENILIKNGRFKIADFGLVSRKKKTSKVAGTEDYMAPEVCDGKSYGEKVDIYSLGILCYKIFIDEDGGNCSSEVRELIIQMIEIKPEKRPSIFYILLKVKLFLETDETKKSHLQSQIAQVLKKEKQQKLNLIEKEKERKLKEAAKLEKKKLEKKEEEARKAALKTMGDTSFGEFFTDRSYSSTPKPTGSYGLFGIPYTTTKSGYCPLSTTYTSPISYYDRSPSSFFESPSYDSGSTSGWSGFSSTPSHKSSGKIRSSEMDCFSCGRSGHYANQCPKTGGYFANVTCYTCGKRGHYSPQCSKY